MKADINWFGVLAHHAERSPERAITVFEGTVTTYAEMAIRATGLATGLHERGVRAGQVVGLLSYNCPEFLETVFAANYLGAIVMPINWRLAAPEVRYILEHSEARALVCDEALVELADDATKDVDPSPLKACIATEAAGGIGPRSRSSDLAHRPSTGVPPLPTTPTASCTPQGRRVGLKA